MFYATNKPVNMVSTIQEHCFIGIAKENAGSGTLTLGISKIGTIFFALHLAEK